MEKGGAGLSSKQHWRRSRTRRGSVARTPRSGTIEQAKEEEDEEEK